MTKLRATMILAVVVMAAAAIPGQAQSCEPGGSPVCGPACSAFYDLVVDGQFAEDCDAWQFDPAADRASDGFPCGWDANYGRITGPTNGWQAISQFVTADQGIDRFSFTYMLEIDDADSSVEVWIGKHPSIWTLVHQASGLTACDDFDIDLGSHPEWVNEPLMILIRANIPDAGKTVKVDRVLLWQQTVD